MELWPPSQLHDAGRMRWEVFVLQRACDTRQGDGGGRCGGGNGDVSVKCLMGSQVFFIRHGESRWNEAQAKRDVLQMVSHVDHPLNEHGFQQVLLGLLLLPPIPRPAPLHQPSPSSPRIRLTTSTQKTTTHLSR